ncbi:hypothetical protein Tco_0856454 [Tanacetum coccineum]|uniref:Uncharacterized protein n=1 Tax=Tanacetum coccineum TaxID=301880 RepID=A0ABQ5B653_9ASTR
MSTTELPSVSSGFVSNMLKSQTKKLVLILFWTTTAAHLSHDTPVTPPRSRPCTAQISPSNTVSSRHSNINQQPPIPDTGNYYKLLATKSS